MSNLENNLEIRVNALFHNEIKKSLWEKADTIYRGIIPKKKGNALENLQEKLKAMQKTLEELTNGLIDLGNNALSNFEKEIDNVPNPEKENTVDKLKELITAEIQEIVKQMTIEKFRQ
jgi:hypothetical protein